MLRRVDNPPNPFETSWREWLGEPPAIERIVWEDHSRTILSRNDSPDLSFRWSVNPYRGCQHACAYCYARPTHEYLGLGAGTDFDSQIVVKPGAPELLAEAFQRRSWRREVVAFSGVTDCYQPLEASLGITRRCLEVCRDFKNPVVLVTKSPLVLRDLDLLQDLQQVAPVQVFLSIPFLDRDIARALEPGAPVPDRRFAAMERLSRAGVPTGLLLAPVVPGLNDRDVAPLLQRSARAGARAASMIALRLPGSTRRVFLQRLEQALPRRAARVRNRLREMRGGRWNETRFGRRMQGEGRHFEAVRRLFEIQRRRLGLDASCAVPEAAPQPRQLALPYAGKA